MAVRIGGGDGGAGRVPLGVEHGTVALALDEIVERSEWLRSVQVPHDEVAVVAGAQQNVRVVRMRFEHERLAFVLTQLFCQHTCPPDNRVNCYAIDVDRCLNYRLSSPRF